MSSTIDFAIQLARQTGQLLFEHFRSSDLQTTFKSDRSAVTNADVAADRMINAAIREYEPDALLMSEELQPCYPCDETETVTQPVWIVDPLDGTTNFSLGLHIWGVLLARLVDGWTETAVLYFPLVNELYWAQLGRGAYLNGQPLKVVPPTAERPLSFFACCARTFRKYQVSIPYKARILGSAAYSMCMVTRGASLLAFEATPKIWDIAAPWLLVQEAGGVIETLDGSQPFPIKPGVDYIRQSYPTIAAATPDLATRAHQQIVPK
jgi:myo-inositol-1(or 4)-monophosphatase